MEIARKVFNNTAVVIILVTLAVASIVAAVFINIDAIALQNSAAETHMISTENSATEYYSEQYDYKKEQENNLNNLLPILESLSHPKSKITKIIDRYIELRYNYEDGPNKEYILSELKDITRKFFLGTVDNSLNYLTGSSKATVVKKYETNNPANNLLNYENDIDNFIYIININGENRIFEYTVFKESGKWVIYAEQEIGKIDNSVTETNELLVPDFTEPPTNKEEEKESEK